MISLLRCSHLYCTPCVTASFCFCSNHPATTEIYTLSYTTLFRSVLAVRIRLPDFDQAVAYTDALAIEQPPFDRHPLALGAARGDVARGEPVEPDVEIRPHRLVAARVQAHVSAPSAWHRGRAARCRSGRRAPIPERYSPSRTPRSGECALSGRRSSCTSGRTRAAGLPENTSA